MLLKIIADENIDDKIINALMEKGFELISISKDYKGLSDSEILKLSVREKAVVLTEDSDFGEWVFAHQAPNVGVIFLRYNFKDLRFIIVALQNFLNKYRGSVYNKFTVITKTKIRMREI